MQRRNRSPGIVALVALVTTAAGIPAVAGKLGPMRDIEHDRFSADLGAASPSFQVRATVSTQRKVADDCRRGKPALGTSDSYVSRGVVKSLTSDCHSCCLEVVFIDDFESGDTTAWSTAQP